MSNDFQSHLARQCAVGREKFGPGERRKGVIEHIQEEFIEIAGAENQGEVAQEWTDVVILSMDGMLRAVRQLLRERMAEAGPGPNIDQQGTLCGFDGEPSNDYVAAVTLSMISAKQAKNELRDFGEWRGKSEDKAIQHKDGVHD
jgi:hypothetical protein